MNYILTTDTNFSFLLAVVWWRKMQKRQNVKHRLQIPHTSCLDLMLRVSSFQVFCTPRKAPGWTWCYVDMWLRGEELAVLDGVWNCDLPSSSLFSLLGSVLFCKFIQWKLYFALTLNFWILRVMGQVVSELPVPATGTQDIGECKELDVPSIV